MLGGWALCVIETMNFYWETAAGAIEIDEADALVIIEGAGRTGAYDANVPIASIIVTALVAVVTGVIKMSGDVAIDGENGIPVF